MKELPEGWAVSLLSDTVVKHKNDIVDGPFGSNLKASEYKSNGIPIIRLQNIARNKFIEKNINFVTEEKAEFLKRHSFIAGDIAVTKLGAPLGKATIIPETLKKGIIVADIVRIRLDSNFIDKRYLCYAINSPLVCKEFEKHTKGTTRQRVNLKHIRELHIPIAPLNEQKRIADKLDQILEEVNSAKARLNKASTILKNLRKSVVQSFTENSKVKADLREYVSIDIGNAFKSKDFLDSGIRLLRGQNIEPNSLRWNNTKYFSPEALTSFKHLFINEGDIILAMDRPIVSAGLKLARAKAADLPCVLVQRVARFKDYNGLLPDFLYILLQSPEFEEHLLGKQTGTQIPHISGKQILDYSVYVPSIEKQEEIVRRVHGLLSLADQIEEKYNSAIESVDKITQSVLGKAFRGELAPQDPNDEPASALLARIKVEKENHELIPKQKRRKASQENKEIKEMILSVLDTLKKEKKPLTAQALLQKSGYPIDSDPEKIEEFFLDIKKSLHEGTIIRERVKNEDIFKLAA